MHLATINKKLILLIATNLLFINLLSPVLAQTATKSIQSKKIHKLHLLRLSGSVAGCCAGFVVGTPICFVKILANETDYGAHAITDGFTDDNGSKLLLVPATIMWLPAATLTSLLEAPCYSLKHAVSADKPFSKEQFSLYELESPT